MLTDDDAGSHWAERARDTLERIAGLLGCDPAAFADDGHHGGTHEAVGARELILAWLDIEDLEDRRRVIDLARALSRSRAAPEPAGR